VSEFVTVGERYIGAARSGNLRMAHGACDAEVILAAGYATGVTCGQCNGVGRIDLHRCGACGGVGLFPNRRKVLGLKLYRMQVTGDLANVAEVETEMARWLAGRLSRGGHKPMPAMQRQELVRDVIRWWIHPSCDYCGGLGYSILEGTPSLSEVECPNCFGMGMIPVRRAVPPRLGSHAVFLVSELDSLCGAVLGDLADVLRRGMDL
jgi:hypothetical protein